MLWQLLPSVVFQANLFAVVQSLKFSGVAGASVIERQAGLPTKRNSFTDIVSVSKDGPES